MELVLCFVAHFIGDWPFQTTFMAENKGKSWEINFYHAAVYTATFIWIAHASWLASIILLVSHFWIDALKARWKIIKHIWQDQLLHFLVIFLLIIFKI
ncbi:MAG: DUF3307 domain-containing protein [Candidatus Marinimicrobia bacterium]|nr:DUF3307 domain-containing protein [Candidatus Neomarinimicrobiota bacterium]